MGDILQLGQSVSYFSAAVFNHHNSSSRHRNNRTRQFCCIAINSVNWALMVYYYNYNCFTALWILYGTTCVSQHQKGKTNLDLLEQEIVSGSVISWAICKSAPRPDRIPPLSFLQAGCPSCHATNSIKALKAFALMVITRIHFANCLFHHSAPAF